VPRQLFRTQYKQRLISGGADEVVAVMPIPAGGVLANVWGEVHLVAGTNIDRDLAMVYACSGELVPELDQVGGLSVDTLWDEAVPKDRPLAVTAGSGEIDRQPESADANVFEEPGEQDFNQIFNVVNVTQKIYAREKLMTVASQGLFEPVASSEADLWMPNDVFKVRIRRKYRVEKPTYCMFAIGIPSMDATTATNEATLTDQETNLYQNMGVAMDLALPEVLGLTETGAETPFAEVATMIAKLVEPLVEEETSGAFSSAPLFVFSRFTFEVQFPKRAVGGPISS